ncbi:DUF4232 domain-containing protein [Streptomyces meridianus]|uniref:DUF4232 domain-containing protein n=1 Tax=Streptomyces meridianus TaxID=2938945 RepID=A0ABT0X6T6_9ACTN|nr:DUF4232 domain-containing protein [Streptomyces meridianus]MCM2578015.1 DUF4232 domain-containing protein [Streptomyces meridianus]
MPATRLARATALALVALTALSLTGCQPGSGRNGKKRHKSSSSGYKSSHRSDGFGSGSSSHRRTSHKHRSTAVRDCTANDLRLTAEPVSRPAHRFLVRAQNTSGRTCELEGYPRVRFDGARQAPDVVNRNRPVSDLKLSPGRSAYAAVQTAAASGSGGTTVKDVEVALLAENKLDVLGNPVRLGLPRGTTVGETAVGYWWTTTSGALKW